MSRFVVHPTPLAGLQVLERRPIGDSRGSLSRLFCSEELQALGWPGPVAQINLTTTLQQGTVRGMHYQRAPHAEMKLVSCLRGEVWDVALDLRPDSASYLQWHGEILTPGNSRAMLIPPGFAHGFQALCADVELLYCHSASHAPLAEAGVRATDPTLNITWPLPITQLSRRDAELPYIEALNPKGSQKDSA